MRQYGFVERFFGGMVAITFIFAGIAIGIAKTVFGFLLPPLEAIYETVRYIIFGGEMKYRRKPVIIEAFQMTRERRQSNMDWPEWLHEAWNKEHWEVGSVHPSKVFDSDGIDKLMINISGGYQLYETVEWKYFIIRESNGELCSCHPDIFLKLHERAD